MLTPAASANRPSLLFFNSIPRCYLLVVFRPLAICTFRPRGPFASLLSVSNIPKKNFVPSRAPACSYSSLVLEEEEGPGKKEKKNKIIELKSLATAGFESKGEYNDKKQSR